MSEDAEGKTTQEVLRKSPCKGHAYCQAVEAIKETAIMNNRQSPFSAGQEPWLFCHQDVDKFSSFHLSVEDELQ